MYDNTHGAKPGINNFPRITEIPPIEKDEKLKCPYCNKALQVGIKKDKGMCDNITTVCKYCKRTLSISTKEV